MTDPCGGNTIGGGGCACDPPWLAPIVPEHIYARMLERSVRSPEGCLVSTYAVGSHGYPSIAWSFAGEKSHMLVHRAAWAYANGPIPAGMTVDHLCHNRPCFEITHLRLLSNLENARRTSGRDWPLGQCINGHGAEHWRPKSEGVSKGGCLLCRAAVSAEHTRRRQARIERERGDRPLFKNGNAVKTHCPRGHPYDMVTTKGRACRRCDNEQKRRYKAKMRLRQATTTG